LDPRWIWNPESSSQNPKVLDVAAVAVMTTGTTTKTGATKLRRHLSAKKKKGSSLPEKKNAEMWKNIALWT